VSTATIDSKAWQERYATLKATKSEIQARSTTTQTELQRLLDLEAQRPLNEGETERYQRTIRAADKITLEFDALRADEIELLRIAPASHVQSGDGARVADFQAMKRGPDPWEQSIVRSSPEELRDRALYACERNEHINEDMTGVVDSLLEDEVDVTNLGARWAIARSRPAYRSAFSKFLRHGGDVALHLTDEERGAFQQVEEVRAAWAEGTTTTGGFAVPADYDLSLMIINSGSSNPFRQIADVKQTVSNVYKGLSTAGVTAGWNTESTETTDRTPAVAQPSWTVHRADAYLEASFEVVADSDLGSEVVRLVQDAKDNLEADAFATGTGGGQPYGLVTRCTALNAYVFSESGSTVERDITIGDVYKIYNALPERHQANASWLMHRAIGTKIRRFGEGAQGNAAFWVDLSGGNASRLIGQPVYYSSAFDSEIVSGSEDNVIVYGDFRAGYRIVDRVGLSLAVNPMVVGTNRRPIGSVGWYAYWRTAGDVTDQTNASHFKVLNL
jgi:HK97 family phage major capsid protein